MTNTLLQEFFLLDPDIHFLNHGSFGACPRPVFEAYQEWQRRLERQPVLFLGRELVGYERQARQALGDYLQAEADDLVYVTNATHGVNIIARSSSGPVIVSQQPPKSLPALDLPRRLSHLGTRHQNSIVQPLVIALLVVVLQEQRDRLP